MNTLDIEDRVRAATQAQASTVAPDSVPPLRLPAELSFRGRRGPRGSMWARWLAPAAAAAAVVALAVVMVTVGRTVNHRPGRAAPASSSSLPARPGPVRTGPPVSSYVASGRVPRYYFSIESPGDQTFNSTDVVVRATGTGTVVDTYTPAYGNNVMAVTAAADDQTFVLDEQPRITGSGQANQKFEPRSFFMVRLDGSGMIASITRLAVSVPSGQLMTGFALSPDGRRLAIAVQPDSYKEPDLTEVKMITLATGETMTWTADGTVGTIGTGPDDAQSLSWASNARTLAFTWGGAGSGTSAGVWLLDVATRGGSLMAHSRQIVSLPAINGAAAATPACQLDAMITQDGSAVVCGAVNVARNIETEFTEYSTATGKVTRIMGYWTLGSVIAPEVDLLWSNASGSVLIGVIPAAHEERVGVISGNEFTPLPAAQSTAATW